MCKKVSIYRRMWSKVSFVVWPLAFQIQLTADDSAWPLYVSRVANRSSKTKIIVCSELLTGKEEL